MVSYAHRFAGCGLPLIDLIHAGSLGLVEAARRFDSSRDSAFVSFASWWVRQAMIHALADRSHSQPMPASVLATPAEGGLASVIPAFLESPGTPGPLAEFESTDDDEEIDQTFEEIQSRASGTPRHADRLRSHLN